jgi:hypothetical protein
MDELYARGVALYNTNLIELTASFSTPYDYSQVARVLTITSRFNQGLCG